MRDSRLVVVVYSFVCSQYCSLDCSADKKRQWRASADPRRLVLRSVWCCPTVLRGRPQVSRGVTKLFEYQHTCLSVQSYQTSRRTLRLAIHPLSLSYPWRPEIVGCISLG